MTSAGRATPATIDEVVVVGCGGIGRPFAVALAASGRTVPANDHPALAQGALLDGWAKGAIVHDLCGMLAAAHAAVPGLTLRRFGDGRREIR